MSATSRIEIISHNGVEDLEIIISAKADKVIQDLSLVTVEGEDDWILREIKTSLDPGLIKRSIANWVKVIWQIYRLDRRRFRIEQNLNYEEIKIDKIIELRDDILKKDFKKAALMLYHQHLLVVRPQQVRPIFYTSNFGPYKRR